MIDVRIICVGKLKEKFLREGCDEYIKRLSRFCRIEVIELPESHLPDSPSQSQISACLEEEGKAILAKVPKDLAKISMCIEGQLLSSEKLSDSLDRFLAKGFSGFCFIIGSSFGLCDMVKNSSDFKLSMSPMTFPHQLARMMLLEQVYRAFQISNGGKYHK